MRFIHLKGVRALKLFGVQGMVVFPFVLYAPEDPGPQLLNHERIHQDQILRDGVIRFYSRYLWEYVKLRLKKMNHDQAYRNISYEQEAYKNHSNVEYKIAARS